MKKVTKKQTYKLLLTGSLLTALGAPIAIAAGCSSSESTTSDMGSSWAFNDHQTVQNVIENATGKNNIMVDSSQWMTPNTFTLRNNATNSGAQHQSRMLSPFRSAKILEAENVYDPVTKEVKNINDSTIIRTSKFRFEMIKAVVLIDESGTEYVFDKDVSFDNDIASTDPRDINSENFLNTLNDTTVGKRISAIKLRARDDLSNHRWVQNITGEKGDPITMDDLYMGTVFGIMGNVQSRYKYSGLTFDFESDSTKETGNFQKFAKAVETSAKITTNAETFKAPSNSLASAALQELASKSQVGIDITPFLDLSKKNQVVVDEGKSFVISFRAQSEPVIKTNFWRYISEYKMFTAHPYSQAIRMKNKYEARLKELSNGILTADEWTAFSKTIVNQIGFYQNFLGDVTEHYSAGTYYLGKKEESQVTLVRNEDYVDPRWLGQVNSRGQRTTIQNYIYRFIPSGNIDAMQNMFIQGTSVYGKYSSLPSGSTLNAADSQEKYGIFRSRGFSATTPVINDITTLVTMPIAGSGFIKHYFNDNFAKLLYGFTSKQMNEDDPAFADGKYLNNIFAGDGLVFRKLLSATMNTFAMVQDYTANGGIVQYSRVDWSGAFNPEGAVYGKDLEKFSPFFLSELYKKDSTASADLIDIAKNFIDKYIATVDSTGKISLSSIEHDTYKEVFTKAVGASKYGPSNIKVGNLPSPFEIVKSAFKALLDKVVGPVTTTDHTQVPNDKKVIFELPSGRRGLYDDSSSQEILNSYQNMLWSIDPRLNVVAVVSPSTKVGDVYSEATIKRESWPSDDSKDVVKYVAKSTDVTGQFKDTYYDDRSLRLYPRGSGFSTFQTYWAGDYDNPLEILLDSFGYIQVGKLLTISYYSDPANEQKYISDPTLAPMKRIVDLVNNDFRSYMSAATLDLIGLTSTRKTEFLNIIKTMKFEDFWKSATRKVDIYDYIGMKGFETLFTAKEETDATLEAGKVELARVLKKKDDNPSYVFTATEATFIEQMNTARAINNDVLAAVDYFGAWTNYLLKSRAWKAYATQYTTKEILESMLAINQVLPDNYNPFAGSILDRTRFIPSLQKTWIMIPGTAAVGLESLSWYRVDLDRRNNYFLDLSLHPDKNGVFKTVKDGGIVY